METAFSRSGSFFIAAAMLPAIISNVVLNESVKESLVAAQAELS
ncbi:hypothetical protein [Agarivorans gilvus]|uniref:Uncharacterized protein n=1 Tax=Agarivorans gilvus TaxID=680279 RepID=A0ABQ1I1I6_9ALTE|nr:hypothetical protein [Agarivorans gilvus]GGB03614.1 hypothetical protein GCM10007414_16190 [Agarivorans gilvus]